MRAQIVIDNMNRPRSKLGKLLQEWEMLLFFCMLGIFSLQFVMSLTGGETGELRAVEERLDRGVEKSKNEQDVKPFYNQYAVLDKGIDEVTAGVREAESLDAFRIYRPEGGEEAREEKEGEKENSGDDEEKTPATSEYEIEYCGKLISPGDNKVALIKDVDSGETVYRQADSTFLGLKIIDFNSYELTVELPSEERETVFFNERFKFEIIEK